MRPEQDSRTAFVQALVARMLSAQGLDRRGAEILTDAFRSNGHRPLRWQQPTRYYPGLEARPWHDPASFDWTDCLGEAFPLIREEALTLQREGRFALDPLSADLADGTWNEFRFYTEGRPNDENLAACPHTAATLQRIPGAASAGLAYFSAIGPKSHVRPHCGPHNARLRCQLGLVAPPGCRMRVGDDTRSWEPGAAVVFDDSFEHEVWNDSDQTRIVLIVDVWHPQLSPEQAVAIRYSEMALIGVAYEVAESWARTGAIAMPEGVS